MANTTLNASGQAAGALSISTLVGTAINTVDTRYAAIVNGTNVPVKISRINTNTGIAVTGIRYNAHDYEYDELTFPRGSVDFTDIVIEEHSTAILEYTVTSTDPVQPAHDGDGLAIPAVNVNTLHGTSVHRAVKRDGTAADNGLYFVNLV